MLNDRMQRYWLIYRQSLQTILEYRVDNLLRLFRYAIMVMFTYFLWRAVSLSNPSLFEPGQLLKYFTIATIIYGLSNFHLDYFEKDIRLGYISTFLVKPVSPYGYYLMTEAATASFDVVIKSIVFLPLSMALGSQYSFSVLQLAVFFLMLPLIFVTAFTSYFVVSSTGYWFTQVDALRMSVMFASRYLSGILVPAMLFPDAVKSVVSWLPWLHFAFTPIELLTNNLSLSEAAFGISVLIVWLGILTMLRKIIWRIATHSYESTGI